MGAVNHEVGKRTGTRWIKVCKESYFGCIRVLGMLVYFAFLVMQRASVCYEWYT